MRDPAGGGCPGEPATASLAVENGRITHVYVMRNPEKLTRIDEAAQLAR
ncbi:hypothetical protein [Streptomyces beihaiensis]